MQQFELNMAQLDCLDEAILGLDGNLAQKKELLSQLQKEEIETGRENRPQPSITEPPPTMEESESSSEAESSSESVNSTNVLLISSGCKAKLKKPSSQNKMYFKANSLAVKFNPEDIFFF